MAGIAALHYREDLFPDPVGLRPERFLEAKPDTYAWIPFARWLKPPARLAADLRESYIRVVRRYKQFRP